MSSKEHWESIYANKPDSELSWTKAESALALALIREASSGSQVLDVGGASALCSLLLDAGYSVAILDISQAALARAAGGASAVVLTVVPATARAANTKTAACQIPHRLIVIVSRSGSIGSQLLSSGLFAGSASGEKIYFCKQHC
ncbi:MAG TPA: hypothetical protein VGY31_08295 [Terriglobia bacterium]|nr:hypothetical protein [Terriglobia bacterium]